VKILLPDSIADILNTFEKNGFEAYVVGGCVRDSLLGREIHDWDVTTSATTEEMCRCFAEERLLATGEKHGTMTLIKDGMPVEITTFRTEGVYSDGRHPDGVIFSRNLTDDLSRRDFTVNAMAYNPTKGLIDCFGGQKDCQDGIIRCVGEAAARFTEDALRILRAFRFMSKLRTAEGLGFRIEAETVHAAADCAERIGMLSAERIREELEGIITAERAGETLALLKETGILQEIPGLEETAATGREWACFPRELPVRMALLFWDLPAEQVKRRMGLLRFKNSDIKSVCGLLENSRAAIRSDEDLLMLAGRLEAEGALVLLQMRSLLGEEEAQSAEKRLHNLLAEGRCFKTGQLAVSGNDMIQLGLKGREIGCMLDRLLKEVMNGAPNERAALLKKAERYFLEFIQKENK